MCQIGMQSSGCVFGNDWVTLGCVFGNEKVRVQGLKGEFIHVIIVM